ncbi:MAG TPA: hypothetical protein VE377_19845 [Candidatus Dormibacteraeota bacterium]|nr:hypothetical protein [Candidatus Dormibacteraeota bacterium]
MRSPLLVLHIIAGTLGMLSGFVAVFLRKGSRQHGLAGNVFVISMLSLGSTGTFLAIMKSQPGNILGGIFTFYLVATAWLTARRRDGGTNILDWGALLVVLALAVVEVTWGLEAAMSPTGLKYAYSPGPYFFLGSVAVLAVVGDIRMLVRKGISGTPRIARHLWRMCFGLFIAASSIFLARQHLFPAFMRTTGMLFGLSFLPIALMIFWLIRVRVTNAYRERTIPSRTPLVHSLVEKRA